MEAGYPAFFLPGISYLLSTMFAFGAAHILKFNRNQLLERRSFKNISDVYGESERKIGGKQMTSAQFERFKIELQEKRRQERFLKGVALLVISLTVISLFILILR